jgi:outer membrane murein-binding lipoprotein Lpp
MAGGVAQAVEGLSNKCEALSSNPKAAKQTNKKAFTLFLPPLYILGCENV